MKVKEHETSVIRAPHDGSEVGVVSLAGPEEVRAALDANVAAARACRTMPAYERAAALRKVADGLVAERADLARTLALEAGEPIPPARIELDRALAVFRDAAEEATPHSRQMPPPHPGPPGAGGPALPRPSPPS